MRHRSPVGGSTLMTSAPKSDRITAAPGPAMKLARSTTLTPEKMLSLLPSVAMTAFLSWLDSASVELRRALLEEGLRALLLVLGARADREERGLEQQPAGLAGLQPLVHRLDRVAHRERRVGEHLR